MTELFRGRDLLSRQWLVRAASVFPAKGNKWISFTVAVVGGGLAVGDVLYRIGKAVLGG